MCCQDPRYDGHILPPSERIIQSITIPLHEVDNELPWISHYTVRHFYYHIPLLQMLLSLLLATQLIAPQVKFVLV